MQEKDGNSSANESDNSMEDGHFNGEGDGEEEEDGEDEALGNANTTSKKRKQRQTNGGKESNKKPKGPKNKKKGSKKKGKEVEPVEDDSEYQVSNAGADEVVDNGTVRAARTLPKAANVPANRPYKRLDPVSLLCYFSDIPSLGRHRRRSSPPS